jgi:hypothetical protein
LVVAVDDVSTIAARMPQLVKLRSVGVTIWLLLSAERGLEPWRSVFDQVDGVLCVSIEQSRAVGGVLREAVAPAMVMIADDGWKEQLALISPRTVVQG